VLTAVERLALSYNLDLPLDSSLRPILGVVPSGAVPMTKDEVREELNETEGNPQIKARIRSLQREAARRRMMAEVPRKT